ncbi:MAG TPA: flagellar basal body rod C-terminal domain-containing protein [Candidatus Baltobacteraceae bacterium]|nr:flagellar basal body rod C-terminal domain-containing protein [Candidatus Baltobacteraceae bacterium]
MSADLLTSAASGMDAQRAALDVAARNVAAAEAAGPNGAYARLVPQFRVVDDGDGAIVQFAGAAKERGTNVDILTEMIAVMNASRSYDADASLFDVGKTLAEKTIDLGRIA